MATSNTEHLTCPSYVPWEFMMRSIEANERIQGIAQISPHFTGDPSAIAALQRTVSSGFNLTDNLNFTQLETKLEAGEFQPMSADTPLQHLSKITLAETEARRWCGDQKIYVENQVSQYRKFTKSKSFFWELVNSKKVY